MINEDMKKKRGKKAVKIIRILQAIMSVACGNDELATTTTTTKAPCQVIEHHYAISGNITNFYSRG